MKTGTGKYSRAINILRKSKPVLEEVERLEEEVIGRIGMTPVKRSQMPDLIEALFGWIYVGWVRRSLVGVSVILVLFFIYQQTMILRGVNEISKREIRVGESKATISTDKIERQMMMLRLTGRARATGNTTISAEQLEQLLNSYSDLQEKYRDLVRIIEADPELKAYIEDKLGENTNKRNNL